MVIMYAPQNSAAFILAALSRAFRKEPVGADDDGTWQRWLMHESNATSDGLLNLVNRGDGTAAHRFRARALALLLVPCLDDAPSSFRYPGRNDGQVSFRQSLDSIEFETFTGEMVEFAVAVLCYFHDNVIAYDVPPRSAFVYERPRLLQAYGRCIAHLLMMVPAESIPGHELFRRFAISDYVISSGACGEMMSGYDLMLRLMELPAVPDRWKWQAVSQLRRRVLAELAGTQQPRREWESAVEWWGKIIGRTMYRKDCPTCDPDIFFYMLRFILRRDVGDIVLFDDDMVVDVWAWLSEDEELRRNFLLHVSIERPYNNFWIHGYAARLQFVREVLEEYRTHTKIGPWAQKLLDDESRSVKEAERPPAPPLL